jgi:hypothetical protein
MSIKTRIVALTLAALVATGSIAATAASAEARDFHGEHGFNGGQGFHDEHGHDEHGFHDGWGWGRRSYNGGFDHDSYYYSGNGYCHWVPRFDIQRNYIGRVRSCGY